MLSSYIVVNVSQRLGAGDGNTTLVLLLEQNVGGLLIDSNTEALQFVLDDSLINQRLVHVKDNENEVASLGHSNDLTTTTLSVFGTLNNTRKIENLDLSTVVHHLTGDSREGCELVGRGCKGSVKSLSNVLRC